MRMNAPLFTVALTLACLAASGADSWTFLPPRDVDPALAKLENPIPRKWSGQKASLAFAEITRGEGTITLDWSAAAEAKRAPKLPGDPRSLWKGRTPPKDPVTEPRLYAVGRDMRLFRDTLPPAAELLPFVVVVDGNPEDGYGGYVLGTEGAGEWSFARTEASITLRGSAPVAHRFDGNWIAGLQWNAPAEGWADFLAARRARRARVLADPRLAATLEKGILFSSRRNPSWNHCVAQYFGWRQRPGGSLLVLERPGRSLATRDVLAGRMPSGTCLEPRLSFDARTALFAFVETQGPLDPFSMPVNERGGDDHYFHLWRVNVDGSGLTQLTRGVYEDFMPCWLPDGDVAFMSTRRRSQSRCFWYGYSNRWQAYTLFRMKADGSDIRQLSWNDVAEWFPALSAEGEILFARWDYIDRDAVRHQNLWSMRPDGTNPKAVWGNETPSPHCTFQPCAVPGSGKIACIASAHHAVTGGPLILIDPSVDENSEAALTHVTPGHYPECEDKNKHDYDDPSPAAHNDWYNSPWAYGEDLFLVCWSRDPMGYEPSRPIPDAALGLYVLAADGTRELLWRDGQYGAGAPQPLVPRAAPPLVRSQLDPALAAAKKGEVFISDVARGLPGAPTGTVRAHGARPVPAAARSRRTRERPRRDRHGGRGGGRLRPLPRAGREAVVLPGAGRGRLHVADDAQFHFGHARRTRELRGMPRTEARGVRHREAPFDCDAASGAGTHRAARGRASVGLHGERAADLRPQMRLLPFGRDPPEGRGAHTRGGSALPVARAGEGHLRGEERPPRLGHGVRAVLARVRHADLHGRKDGQGQRLQAVPALEAPTRHGPRGASGGHGAVLAGVQSRADDA